MRDNFPAIRRLVIEGRLNNEMGFRANDVINCSSGFHPPTIKKFLDKHTDKMPPFWFERIERGLYRIRREYL